MKALEIFTLKVGTRIKIRGIPFELAQDTTIFGTKDNFEKAVVEKRNSAEEIVYGAMAEKVTGRETSSFSV